MLQFKKINLRNLREGG